MPTNITDVSAFTTATSPADGDADSGATFLASFQKLANRTRWLAGVIGGATYPNAGVTVTVPLGGAVSLGSSGWTFQADVDQSPKWSGNINGGLLLIPISAYLRTDGTVLTGANVIVKQGNALHVTADVRYLTHDFVTPTNEPVDPVILAFQDGTGAATMQKIALPAMNHDVDRTANDYYVGITASGLAGTNPDELHAIQLIFTDYGPRNT